MRYFCRLHRDIDVQPFLEELARADDAWEQATGRQEKIRVQREALAVPLRALRRAAIRGRKRRDVQESRWTKGSMRFPVARDFLLRTAQELECHPGRAKLVSLPPGRRVYPHVDRGEYYRLHARFHLVLRSSRGSYLRAGDEEVTMREGELWWFDNKQIHEAYNDGDDNRIHLIFDLLPKICRDVAFG